MEEQQSPAEDENGALPAASDEESSVSDMFTSAEVEEFLDSDGERSEDFNKNLNSDLNLHLHLHN